MLYIDPTVINALGESQHNDNMQIISKFNYASECDFFFACIYKCFTSV